MKKTKCKHYYHCRQLLYPPVTYEIFLVEDSSIGTEEGDGVEAEVGVLQADVVGLAVLLGVRVVTPHYQPGAREGGVLGESYSHRGDNELGMNSSG